MSIHRPKLIRRPNASSAHYGRTIGDHVRTLSNGYKRKRNGIAITTVGDYCDECLPKITNIRVYRQYLSLRKKGYKMVCTGCFMKLRREHGSLKGKKIIGDYRTSAVMRGEINNYGKANKTLGS